MPVAPGILVNTPGAALVDIGDDCHWNEVAAYLVNVKVILLPKHTDVAEVIVPPFAVDKMVTVAELEVKSGESPEINTLYSVPTAGKVAVFVTPKVAVV